MRNIARNHHYVPQFYLKGFSDPNLQNEQLHVIDKGERRHFVTTAPNIAVQRDFNRINIPGHSMDEIERQLAQIEGKVATVLRSIAENATLPEDDADMDYLIVFVAILAANNPQIRERLINRDREISRQMMQSLVTSREVYESRLSDLGMEDRIGYEAARAFVESENYTINVEDPFGYYLAVVFNGLYETVLPVFSTMDWSLVIAEEGETDFVCSDLPAVLFKVVNLIPHLQLPYTITSAGLILPNKATQINNTTESLELTMPLNPRMAIYATTFPTGYRMSPAYINKRTIDASTRHIYCSNLDFKFCDNEVMKSGWNLVDV
ncbi:MAG: DUF4238 domain-containing protein [Candidatus Poribacteria bacterium]|nr:DUF4238 domain-containing protein [Candidatus Poribacteria bacterium]